MLYYNTTMTSRTTDNDAEKIIPFPDINRLAEKTKDKKKVLVGGCFDLFHYGHLSFLKRARQAGDLLIVALEGDEFILKTKKRQPVHTQAQRAEILSRVDLVDYIILLPLLSGNEDYFRLTKAVSPSVIAVTSGDPVLKYKRQQAEAVGGRILEVDLLKEFSSSNIMRYAAVFGD